MTATLHIDHLEGKPNGVTDERGWITLERVFRVTGLTGVGYQLMHNALKVRGLPHIRDEHPQLKNMLVVNHKPQIVDIDKVDVTVVYERRNDFPSIAIGATARMVDTDRDSSGNRLSVVWDGDTQYPTVPIPANVTTIDITRREKGDPYERSAMYVGTYNNGEWKIGQKLIATDAQARFWRCTEYSGVSTDGIWFDVSIGFEKAPSTGRGTDTFTFDQRYGYQDSRTGGLPSGFAAASAGDQAAAEKTWTAEPVTDFNTIVGELDFSLNQ